MVQRHARRSPHPPAWRSRPGPPWRRPAWQLGGARRRPRGSDPQVTDQPDGQPVVELEPGSTHGPAAFLVAGGHGLRAGPGPYKALHLTGTARASDPLDESLRAYRLSLLSTRLVSSTSVTVPLGEFKAAEPDPLWQHAPQALSHLGEAHDRAAGLRPGPRTPRDRGRRTPSLDRDGLELAAIGADGIRTVRLPFPAARSGRCRRSPTASGCCSPVAAGPAGTALTRAEEAGPRRPRGTVATFPCGFVPVSRTLSLGPSLLSQRIRTQMLLGRTSTGAHSSRGTGRAHGPRLGSRRQAPGRAQPPLADA